MGWKIVRDWNQKMCSGFVSGQWRISPDPVSALTKKLGEEYGEFCENRDPGELYDLLDVVNELISLLDADDAACAAHLGKVRIVGMFSDHVEWHPNPDIELKGNDGPVQA